MGNMLNVLYEKPMVPSGWEAFKSRGCPAVESSGLQPHSFALIAELPPLLRTLLVTDGTVTRSLEAFFWEPVEVQQVALSSIVSAHEIPWVEAAVGEKLLLREVKLIGKNSRNVYASAYSVVRLDLIPLTMRTQLERGGIGIGVLIREAGLESFRELLDVGTASDLSFETMEPEASDDEHTDIVYRTYRIYLGKQPALLVTEKFPKDLYRAHD